jgi:uncharacterized protein YndB with AHSA1/START domain
MRNPSEPIATAQMVIRRPAAVVFEAVVDPAVTCRFWFTRGSGRLEAAKRVRWEWEMYGVGSTIEVKAIEPHTRISIEWDGPEDPTSVEWTFEAKGKDQTFVNVKNWGFSGSMDDVIAKALDSTGGFHLVLPGAKFFLEHGIEPHLVEDRDPDAVVPSWSKRC